MRISKKQTQSPLTMRRTEAPKHYNPNFKGAAIVGIMDAIDRGGLAASFVIQDTLGTNLPRPIMGLMRNQKENQGKKNTAFALKEAIREFTTGPSMFIIPGLILKGVAKKGATALQVAPRFIKGLGDIFQDTISEADLKLEKSELKTKYYENVISNVLEETTGKSKDGFKKEIKELAEGISNYEKAKGNGVLDNFFGKIKPGTKESILSDLTDKYVKITKGNLDPTADFLSATIGNSTLKEMSKTAKNSKSATTSFKNLIGFMTDYSTDAIDKTKKAVKSFDTSNFKKSFTDFVSNFTDKRIVGRFGLNIGMMAAVVSFLTIIPRLYNLTSKENPGMTGLVENNSQPQTNKTKKGDA